MNSVTLSDSIGDAIKLLLEMKHNVEENKHDLDKYVFEAEANAGFYVQLRGRDPVIVIHPNYAEREGCPCVRINLKDRHKALAALGFLFAAATDGKLRSSEKLPDCITFATED